MGDPASENKVEGDLWHRPLTSTLARVCIHKYSCAHVILHAHVHTQIFHRQTYKHTYIHTQTTRLTKRRLSARQARRLLAGDSEVDGLYRITGFVFTWPDHLLILFGER